MIIAKIATAVISPLGSALILGIIGLFFGLIGRRRLAFFCSFLALAWLWFWSLPVASFWLSNQIAAPFPPQHPHQVPQAEAIVILGGGITPADQHHLQPDLNQAADRIWYGTQLYHAGKAPLVVLSGGQNKKLHSESEAAAMQQLAEDLGVPPEAILLEEQSRNTQQNAQYTTQMLHQRGIKTILLVTSASHMKRSLQHFGRAGLVNAIPAATDYKLPYKNGWRNWLPDTDDLDDNAKMFKEYVGQWLGPNIQWTPTQTSP
jgi:uncharacterized SAM-binding protein YcdF (DUF218 family)